MKKLMLFRAMCYQAWSDFTKHLFAIVLLTACFVGINFLSIELNNYFELLDIWRTSLPFAIPYFVLVHGLRLLQACLAALAYVFFMKYILDIVYARHIDVLQFKFSMPIIHVVIFDTIVYYITLHEGMPLRFSSDSILELERSLRDVIADLSPKFDALLFFSIAL